MSVLTPVSGGPAVIACTSCRRAGDAAAGATLAAALRAAQRSDLRYAGIAVQAMACLFACADSCAVHVRAPGRIGYVLGRFAPDAAAARAILDYAVHHAASAEGVVAFADWPAGVMGHFIVRVPPPGFVAD